MLTISSIFLPFSSFALLYKLTVYLTNPINVNFVCFYVFFSWKSNFFLPPPCSPFSPSINCYRHLLERWYCDHLQIGFSDSKRLWFSISLIESCQRVRERKNVGEGEKLRWSVEKLLSTTPIPIQFNFQSCNGGFSLFRDDARGSWLQQQKKHTANHIKKVRETRRKFNFIDSQCELF